ncbi:MAG: bifunctional folylpolyglutamate synthase/dihydrofolate synthase, partial [Flavisolibacter sp.]
MNYEETIDYLYNSLPMFSRMGSAAYKKDITNTIILCEAIGNPQEKFKSIHVAGTNGKGSVTHMLAGIFQSAGYKTGLYTSPHLYDFRERIRINGEMVSKDFVTGFVERVIPLIKEIDPSFFEITVAMAFEYFAQSKVDIAIIEVGLGGRLDSTNIIKPELSIITNIGWDHMNMLGNSLEEIAMEKAGIIKENIPVVVGEKKSETENVFYKAAADKSAPLFFAADRFEIMEYKLNPDFISVSVFDKKNNSISTYELDLPGIYQTKNIKTVLQAVELMDAYKIEKDIVRAALKNIKQLTGLQGRWEVIYKNPTVVLEVAHNRDGMEQMLDHIEKLSFNKLHLIIGMVKDKDVEEVLQLLPVEADYYFTQANIPRALDVASLQAKASGLGLQGINFSDVNLALKTAMKNAAK